MATGYYQGIVQELSNSQMSVFANNQLYTFPISDPPPKIGQPVMMEDSEDGQPRIHMMELSLDYVIERMYRYDHLATNRMATGRDINDDSVKSFWGQGYIVVDQLLDLNEVEVAQLAVDDIIHGNIVGPRLQWMRKEMNFNNAEERELAIRKLHNFIDFSPALHHVCYHPATLSILERIFGEEPKFLGDQAILKPPSRVAGGEKPWHQDMAYGIFSQTKMICGIWIALDEAALDNGCMHLIPGSHRDGPVPHYAMRDWQICDSRISLEKDVVVPLRPGGALFFAGLLHHGTPPNSSKKRRRALQFHYSPASSTRMTSQEFKLMFTNEMTNAEC